MMLSFSPGDNLSAVVIAAVGADVMGQTGVMALGAFGQIGRFDFPVSAAFSASGPRMSSFGKWHSLNIILFFYSFTIAFLMVPAGGLQFSHYTYTFSRSDSFRTADITRGSHLGKAVSSKPPI